MRLVGEREAVFVAIDFKNFVDQLLFSTREFGVPGS